MEPLSGSDCLTGAGFARPATSIPDLDARIDAEIASVRRRRLPFVIVAGHPYDAAYSAWLGERLPQTSVTEVPNSGHFPHLGAHDRFAALRAGTAHWGV